MKRHKLLSGETIGLEDIEARDVVFLKNLQRMATSGISFFELERVAIGPGSPALQGWSRVTREIGSSPSCHKAIQKERLAAQRDGNVLLVDRGAVLRYKRVRSQSVSQSSNSRAQT